MSCFCCWMITPRETQTLSTKTLWDLIYEQKLSTHHQIMGLRPFHMGISVDKEIIGPLKFFLRYFLKSGRTARENHCNFYSLFNTRLLYMKVKKCISYISELIIFVQITIILSSQNPAYAYYKRTILVEFGWRLSIMEKRKQYLGKISWKYCHVRKNKTSQI